MPKVAFVDHSFHEKTGSTRFLSEILKESGVEVCHFWDESWNGKKPVHIGEPDSYDAVVVFQANFDKNGKEFYKDAHPNVTYIPMLDQFVLWRGPLYNIYRFLKPFQGCKTLNFSTAMHGVCKGAGIQSRLFRFYRKPAEKRNEIKGLHGFLWVRLEQEVSWEKVKKLIGETVFDSFHIHAAKDPGSPDVKLPSDLDIKKHNITITTGWFDDKSEYEKILDRCNVFFAPRMEEGIGQSFLEAFSRGICIVAPDNGTMNEYLQHGFTGLLYDREKPAALDFSDVEEISVRAFASAGAGYSRWCAESRKIADYILIPCSEAYKDRYYYFKDCDRYSDDITFLGFITVRLKKKIRDIVFMRKLYSILKKFSNKGY